MFEPGRLNQVMKDVSKNALQGNDKYTFSLLNFQLDNVYPIFEKYFNDKAKLAMSNKTDGFTYSYPVNRDHHFKLLTLLSQLGLKKPKGALAGGALNLVAYDMVYVFGVRCDRPDMVKAIEHLIVSINHLASKGFLKASMVELGVIRFEHVPGKPDEVAVLSYLTLDKKGEKYVAANMPSITVTEGNLPTRLESL